MPINYLALKALKHYSLSSQAPDSTRERCAVLHAQLRANILKNVANEYRATGYFWEQYDDQTGRGIRGHPFTGWTSLFVNIMYEMY
jgi:mannosyl-oligosaccharide glucosidase